MPSKVSVLFLNLLVNFVMFSLLFLGVQNANKKNAINFLSYQSVEMPLGFILGVSFILGTTTGSLPVLFSKNSKDN